MNATVDSIDVRINGELKRIPAQLPLVEVLKVIGVAPERVAVELNREIVRKREWNSTLVPAGAEIEIVEFVGGG
jgi:thiamine biosynthesis protein ThiS